MKAIVSVLLFALLASVALAGGPDRKTVVIRYQPPTENSIQSSAQGLIPEAEVTKAYRTLKSSLRKVGMDVQLGTIQRPEGSGRLWISGQPLDTWLSDNSDIHESDFVTAQMIVEAGLRAGADLMNGGEVAKVEHTPRAKQN